MQLGWTRSGNGINAIYKGITVTLAAIIIMLMIGLMMAAWETDNMC